MTAIKGNNIIAIMVIGRGHPVVAPAKAKAFIALAYTYSFFCMRMRVKEGEKYCWLVQWFP